MIIKYSLKGLNGKNIIITSGIKIKLINIKYSILIMGDMYLFDKFNGRDFKLIYIISLVSTTRLSIINSCLVGVFLPI